MGERGDGGTGSIGGGGEGEEGEEARTLNRSSILCNLWVCPPNTYIDLGDLHLNRMLRYTPHQQKHPSCAHGFLISLKILRTNTLKQL
jgi:hypothetical protein